MNLHANAALSLNRRPQLCRRVLEEDWTLREAAEAAEVSVRCARSGSAVTEPRASSDFMIAPQPLVEEDRR
jgi:leucine-zipper of insertion element IS481